jgi:hypothetical protein
LPSADAQSRHPALYPRRDEPEQLKALGLIRPQGIEPAAYARGFMAPGLSHPAVAGLGLGCWFSVFQFFASPARH